MARIDSDTLRRLRGQLGEEDPNRPGRGPGARGLEHMARNRRCQRLAAVTLAGASAEAAARRLGVPNRSEEASPFAAARGGKFEDHLFAEDCRRIWSLYERAGHLPEGFGAREDIHSQWLDMEKGPEDKGEFSFEERRRLTEEILLRRARGDLETPVLILKPRLAVQTVGQEFAIEPDALFAAPGERFYRVVEIKSYADRRGYTDQAKTGSAARQAAVGVVAVRQLLENAKLDAELCLQEADLIFSNSGSNSPTLNRLEIAGEVENIYETLKESEPRIREVLKVAGERSLDDPQVLLSLDTYLCSTCATHCPMFEHCRQSAIRAGSPITLGDAAQELFSGIASLSEAVALRDGNQAASSPDEATVAELLSAAWTAFQSAHEIPSYQALAAGEDEDAGLDEETTAPLYAGEEGEEPEPERLEVAS